MAGVLHGSACTTLRVRAELPAPQEATRILAARDGLNPKTVQKWRKRTTTADQPMGPKRPHSTVLTEAEEAIIVEFRRRTLLPPDDVLGCLRETIPTLTRSALHRCLVRHGISRLPREGESPSKRGRFAETRIGSVHIDHCELRLAEGKLHMFLAIDRGSRDWPGAPAADIRNVRHGSKFPIGFVPITGRSGQGITPRRTCARSGPAASAPCGCAVRPAGCPGRA